MVNISQVLPQYVCGVRADSTVVLSDTVIQAIVDTGATGNVSVTTPYGTGTKPGFTFIGDTTNIPDTLFVQGSATANRNQFALYPNPASNHVIWQQPVTNHVTRLQLIDVNGRIVKTISVGSGVTQITVPVSGLHTGVYKLLWSDGRNKVTRSLLKK